MSSFSNESFAAYEAVNSGLSVAITSTTGGGKSTLVRRVTKQLERTSRHVTVATGMSALSDQPYSGIAQLSSDLNSANIRSSPLLALNLADAISKSIDQTATIVVIDDIHFFDSKSLAVLDQIRRRTDCPLVLTYPHQARWQSPDDAIMVNSWSDLVIDLPPLRFEEIGLILQKVLGDQVHPELISDIYSLSAGNLRLANEIIRSAKQYQRIENHNGVWIRTHESLWNPHLMEYTRVILGGLPRPTREKLMALSVLPPQSIEVYEQVLGDQVLLELEERELLVVVNDNDLPPGNKLTVTPPVIAEMTRNLPRNVEYRRIERQVQVLRGMVGLPARGLVNNTPLTDWGVSDALSPRHYLEEQARSEAAALLEVWANSRGLPDAVTYLAAVWDTGANERNINRVFAETEVNWDRDIPSLLFEYSAMQAEWMCAAEGQPTSAIELMHYVGKTLPSMRANALSFIALVDIQQGLSPDYEAKLLTILEEDPGCVFAAVVLAYAYLIDARPVESLEMLCRSESMKNKAPRLNALRTLTRGIALHLLGDEKKTQAFVEQSWKNAWRGLDRREIGASAYSASIFHMETGNWERAEQILGSALTLGDPGAMVSQMHSALLRLEGLIAARTERPGLALSLVNTDAGPFTKDGPLPGMWQALAGLIVKLATGDANDRSRHSATLAKDIAKQCVAHGYLYAASTAYHLSLGFYPTIDAVQGLAALRARRPYAASSVYLDLVQAIAEEAPERAAKICIEYNHDSRHVSIVLALRAATDKSRLEGNLEAATIYEQMLEEQQALLPKTVSPNFAPLSVPNQRPLTSRELEVGLLAGTHTNAQIAAELGVSIRTVENHITSALRKTGLRNRIELFSHASAVAHTQSDSAEP